MREKVRVCIALLAAIVALSAAAAQKPAGPKVTYRCRHIGKQKIDIDGVAKEPAWQLVEPLKDFRLINIQQVPQWPTQARLLWDDANLYVFFDCAIDGIRTEVKKRDDPVWNSECAEVFLCPRGPDAFYYEFNFNPHNAIYDSRVESWKYEDQARNWQKWSRGYNAKIESATTVRRHPAGKVTGWTVEAAIPFKDFDIIAGRTPADGDTWLFNAFRIAVKSDGKMEFSHWQPVKPEFHRPQQFPRLQFVKH